MFARSIVIAAVAIVSLSGCADAPVAPADGTVEGLFAVERSFAQASTERGIRASLEYFAVDGIDC